jgi:hypothetical protein
MAGIRPLVPGPKRSISVILTCSAVSIVAYQHFKDQDSERVPVDTLVVTFTLNHLGSHCKANNKWE